MKSCTHILKFKHFNLNFFLKIKKEKNKFDRLKTLLHARYTKLNWIQKIE